MQEEWLTNEMEKEKEDVNWNCQKFIYMVKIL